MDDDTFEWDDAKAESNYRKHGVDFETATETFADPFAIERIPICRIRKITRSVFLSRAWRPAAS
jgi:uncharacterized DUF497 family protein